MNIESKNRPSSDAAAVREALKSYVEYSKLVCRMGMFIRDRLVEITTKAKAALAAPPRNCDVGTLTEQQQRFNDFCENMQRTDKACCGGCPIVHLRLKGVIDNSCELAWAQMPYEEGDSDGRK